MVDLAYDVGALRVYLAADAAVAALVGGRVYGHELPDSVAALMPTTAIVINSAGLGSRGLAARSNMPVSSRTNIIRCYGVTPLAARRLFDAVNRAMRTLARRLVNPGGGLPITMLYSAVSTGGVTVVRELQTDWPMAFSSYDVLAAEVA